MRDTNIGDVMELPDSPREKRQQLKRTVLVVRELRRLQNAINMYGHNVVTTPGPGTIKAEFSEAVHSTETAAMDKLAETSHADLLDLLIGR